MAAHGVSGGDSGMQVTPDTGLPEVVSPPAAVSPAQPDPTFWRRGSEASAPPLQVTLREIIEGRRLRRDPAALTVAAILPLALAVDRAMVRPAYFKPLDALSWQLEQGRIPAAPKIDEALERLRQLTPHAVNGTRLALTQTERLLKRMRELSGAATALRPTPEPDKPASGPKPLSRTDRETERRKKEHPKFYEWVDSVKSGAPEALNTVLQSVLADSRSYHQLIDVYESLPAEAIESRLTVPLLRHLQSTVDRREAFLNPFGKADGETKFGKAADKIKAVLGMAADFDQLQAALLEPRELQLRQAADDPAKTPEEKLQANLDLIAFLAKRDAVTHFRVLDELSGRIRSGKVPTAREAQVAERYLNDLRASAEVNGLQAAWSEADRLLKAIQALPEIAPLPELEPVNPEPSFVLPLPITESELPKDADWIPKGSLRRIRMQTQYEVREAHPRHWVLNPKAGAAGDAFLVFINGGYQLITPAGVRSLRIRPPEPLELQPPVREKPYLDRSIVQRAFQVLTRMPPVSEAADEKIRALQEALALYGTWDIESLKMVPETVQEICRDLRTVIVTSEDRWLLEEDMALLHLENRLVTLSGEPYLKSHILYHAVKKLRNTWADSPSGLAKINSFRESLLRYGNLTREQWEPEPAQEMQARLRAVLADSSIHWLTDGRVFFLVMESNLAAISGVKSLIDVASHRPSQEQGEPLPSIGKAPPTGVYRAQLAGIGYERSKQSREWMLAESDQTPTPQTDSQGTPKAMRSAGWPDVPAALSGRVHMIQTRGIIPVEEPFQGTLALNIRARNQESAPLNRAHASDRQPALSPMRRAHAYAHAHASSGFHPRNSRIARAPHRFAGAAFPRLR